MCIVTRAPGGGHRPEHPFRWWPSGRRPRRPRPPPWPNSTAVTRTPNPDRAALTHRGAPARGRGGDAPPNPYQALGLVGRPQSTGARGCRDSKERSPSPTPVSYCSRPIAGREPALRAPLKRTPKEPGGRSSKTGVGATEAGHIGGLNSRSRRKPGRGGRCSRWKAASPEAGSSARQPDEPVGAFAESLALPLTAVLECENDAGGRFTLRPSGDSHGGRQP